MLNKKLPSIEQLAQKLNSLLLYLLSKAWGINSLMIILTLVFSGFILPEFWTKTGNGDWDYHLFTLNIFSESITNYGQFPLWNPWSAGGHDYLVNPQTVPLGFLSILSFIFPTHIALKIAYLMYYIIGLKGSYLLLHKKLHIEKSIALWAGCLYVFGSYFTWHVLAKSHANACMGFIVPWLIYYYLDFKSQGWHWKNILIPTLFIVQIMIGGGTHFIIYIPLFFGLYVFCDIISFKKRVWKHLSYPISIFGLGIGLSLWKIIPAVLYAIKHPRIYTDNSKSSLINLFQSLADQHPDNVNDSFSYWGWWEYGAFFSFILIAIIIYYWKLLHARKALVILMLFILWLSMGNYPMHFNPWYFLNKYVPVFTSLRVPSRMIVFILFSLMVTTAIIFQKKSMEHPLWSIIMVAVLFHLFIINKSIQDNFNNSPTVDETMKNIKVVEPIQFQSINADDRMYPLQKHNIAVINSYEPLPMAYNAFEGINLSDNITLPLFDDKKATLKKWSPNQMVFRLKQDTLILNHNYAEGWKVTINEGTVFNASGKLALKGISNEEIGISYSNPHMGIGLLFSYITACLLIFALIITGLNKRKGKYPL